MISFKQAYWNLSPHEYSSCNTVTLTASFWPMKEVRHIISHTALLPHLVLYDHLIKNTVSPLSEGDVFQNPQ